MPRPRVYVNLSLRAADADPALLDRLIKARLAPELGLDPVLMDAKSPAWHKAFAARLREEGLPCALHLPFFDLQPGSADSRIRAASLDRLKLAMDTAADYAPDHLVGHAAYDRFLYIKSFEAWRDRASDTWAKALAAWPEHPPLYLENTFETDPETVAGTVAALKTVLPPAAAARTGACFDIGHWHSFAEGSSRGNLAAWIAALAPHLRHLHLHDNDGAFDHHLGPGQGSIPFDLLFALLTHHNLTPSTTFEPHTPSAFAAALTFLTNHPYYSR